MASEQAHAVPGTWPADLADAILLGRPSVVLREHLDTLLRWYGAGKGPDVSVFARELDRRGVSTEEARQLALVALDRLLFAKDLSLPYAVFGLYPGATPEEIKQRYSRLIQIFHPDRLQSDPEWLTERTARLNRAYEEIKDEFKTQAIFATNAEFRPVSDGPADASQSPESATAPGMDPFEGFGLALRRYLGSAPQVSRRVLFGTVLFAMLVVTVMVIQFLADRHRAESTLVQDVAAPQPATEILSSNRTQEATSQETEQSARSLAMDFPSLAPRRTQTEAQGRAISASDNPTSGWARSSPDLAETSPTVIPVPPDSRADAFPRGLESSNALRDPVLPEEGVKSKRPRPPSALQYGSASRSTDSTGSVGAEFPSDRVRRRAAASPATKASPSGMTGVVEAHDRVESAATSTAPGIAASSRGAMITEEALRDFVEKYADTFSAGDAVALGQLFAASGTDRRLRGRTAIFSYYERLFQRTTSRTMRVVVGSVRPLGTDQFLIKGHYTALFGFPLQSPQSQTGPIEFWVRSAPEGLQFARVNY